MYKKKLVSYFSYFFGVGFAAFIRILIRIVLSFYETNNSNFLIGFSNRFLCVDILLLSFILSSVCNFGNRIHFKSHSSKCDKL